ncbi:MAG: D-alanine--D-alanine ligase [Chloroflexota bacterium]
MYICVLSSPPDENDIPYDPSSYFTDHRWEHFIPDAINFKSEIDALAAKGFDAFVNLCDGTPDDELSGIGLVNYLEERNIPFTGANSAFFDPTRSEMKQAAKDANVPIPGSVFINSITDLNNFDHVLSFPLLVKPLHGYASVGLSKESRVIDFAGLQRQTLSILNKFDGALIEEFIEGREFTTLVVENPDNSDQPVSFQPVEFLFPPGESFKHFDLKWKEYELMSVHPVTDKGIDQQLRILSERQFVSMHGNGYARCDFRMNADGELFLLEINPNCGIFYPPNEPGSADHILLNDPAGHLGFLDLILRSAIKRSIKVNQNATTKQI